MTNLEQLEQYKQEHIAWLKTLELLQLEIVSLKNQVAKIAQKKLNADTLEHIEYFQTNFLNKDTVIALLRRDINQQHLALSDIDFIEPGMFNKPIKIKQDNLRNDISKIEKELSSHETEFNNCFKQVLS